MSYSDEENSDFNPSGSESSYLSEDDADNPELLTLNMAFGSKKDTIQVHWDDDPEDLAKVESHDDNLKM